MASRGLVLFVGMLGGAAALATGKPADIHNDAVCGVICVDSINDCGQKYGGCYDPCVDPAPTAPPCLAPYTNIWYPTPPPEEIIPFTDEEGEDCSKIIVCVDGITECGIPFGACIPDCKPWNITIPTCPEIPESPESPDTPETPETPDTPDTPDTPETPDTTETAPSVAVEAPEQPGDLGEIAPWIPGGRHLGRRQAVDEPEGSEGLGEVVPWTPEPKGQV